MNEQKLNIKIALIHILNSTVKTAMNKDLNGGFGTRDNFGDSLFSKLLMRIKQKGVRLPIISFAFLQAILKNRGAEVFYFEGTIPQSANHFDVILVYGTIVDYKNENRNSKSLMELFPEAKVGFFGPFPSLMPELFAEAHFVIKGEVEAFFMNEFANIEQLISLVLVKSDTDMNALPSPDFDGFPIASYNYKPVLTQTPFIALQASKGCPYSCRFYCVYGDQQGAVIRQRSAKKVVDDIVVAQQKFNIKGVQFRDAVFGLKKGYMESFSNELLSRNIDVTWGIETRLDLLNEENLSIMFQAGLRNVNVGVETADLSIAKKSKRLLVDDEHQQKIVRFCKQKGINISAFYIFALEGDTEASVLNTIKYAIKLNTTAARFAVSTPYPGTGFYKKLQMENRLLSTNFETYDQFSLVFKHENLTPIVINKLLNKAYRKYYLRFNFIIMFFLGQIKSLFRSSFHDAK